MKNTHLWRTMGVNLLIAIVIYACLLGLLWLAETLVPSLSGELLHFDDLAWIIGIPASTVGVCYILTIRDPENYTGFYVAVLMSLLLALQFFLIGNYDLALLNVCVCAPLQVKSIVEWSKKDKQVEAQPFTPEFLSMRSMLRTLAAFLSISALDYLQILYLSHSDKGVLMNILSCFIFSCLVIANYWLIYRKNDSWLYWIFYALAGIVFFTLSGNAFSVVLFVFFLVINSLAAISWIRMTPKDNYGWLKGV